MIGQFAVNAHERLRIFLYSFGGGNVCVDLGPDYMEVSWPSSWAGSVAETVLT